MNPRLTAALIFLFSIVWAASMIVDAVPAANYDPPAAIHGVPTLVIGLLVNEQLRKPRQ